MFETIARGHMVAREERKASLARQIDPRITHVQTEQPIAFHYCHR
jgi:hypothetical protein